MKKELKEAAKAGFTLVELLVVVAILGILGAVAVTNLMGSTDEAKVTATRTTISSINQALIIQTETRGRKLPTSQDAFESMLTDGDDDNPPAIEGGRDALNDAWGNRIQYQKTGKRFLLTSFGPDGEEGGGDDIYNREKK